MSASNDVLARLVAEHGDELVRYAYLLTQESAAAQDLVQDALVRTFIRMRTGADVKSAKAYVRQAMLRIYIDSHRRRIAWLGVRHLVTESLAHTDPDTESQLDVQTAIASLSPQERAAVVLRYYDDLTVSDVASRMGLSLGTVKRYLHNATPKLAAALSSEPVPGRTS